MIGSIVTDILHTAIGIRSLGQYERKLRKPSIQIALQCDSTETGIAVGWHEDWLQEERERRALRTDSSWKENGSMMLSRLVDTFFSRTSWTMLLYAENHSISVA